jgi:hypothetical protein
MNPDDFLEEQYEDRTYVEDEENLDDYEDEDEDEDEDDYEDDIDPAAADAMTLASAGWGTDEDYGLFEDPYDGF